MRNISRRIVLAMMVIIILSPGFLRSEQTGEPVYGRVDPAKWRVVSSHYGAGVKLFQRTLDARVNRIFSTPFLWTDQSRIPPRCGNGLNVKRFMEGIYWGFNIPAEFTVDGRTSLLPAGANVLCRAGHYHGIFNPSYTDTLEFLHTAVAMHSIDDTTLGAFDFHDSLTTQTLVSPPPFPWTLLDRALLRPVERFHGGMGTIRMRRTWDPDSFLTPWYAVDHLLLPPGTSVGNHICKNVEEVFYILSGKGTVTVNGHSWDVGRYDSIPCTLRDAIGLVNDSGADLELVILTVAVDKRQDPSYTDLSR